jgi:phosphotransferase system HPr-like phosphotransfer protein
MNEFIEQACDISFSEKARILSEDYLRCCLYMAGHESPRHLFTKKLFSELVSTSLVLEDFLDFHGAKNNHNWFLYRELTAAVHHLSLGGYSQKHISNRLIFYNLPDSEAFESHGNEALHFLTDCLMKLAPVILNEAKRLEIGIPQPLFDAQYFPGITTGEMLGYDMEDEGGEEQKKNIVKLASDFLSIAGYFDQLSFYEPYSYDEILTLVPDKINEVEIRRYEMLVHNLQSYFDTYVIHGGFSHGKEKLKRFRSFFSVVFHLLQLIGRLLHFYERHLHEAGYKIRYKAVQEELSSLVDPQKLLDLTINYGLYWVCHYLSRGRGLAREILNEYIERTAITVGIPVTRGFHCRPSLLVAKIVQHYGGQVEMVVNGDRFDSSSVLDIQWAGGKIQNEGISRVSFEGDARALKDIKILASVNYGEDTMGKGIPLPRELNYLRED